MIEIKYQCSNGNEYNLIGDRMRATDGNFHKYKWERDVSEIENGENLKKFKKESITYSITLSFRGKLEDRKQLLNDLTNDFEYDVVAKKAGTFYFGEYYIKGYVIESETKVSDLKNTWSQKTIQIYCPYPFWIREETHQFFPNTQLESSGGLDFPFDFSFDFAADDSGYEQWNVEHYASSHFKMTVYGPCVNPMILINGYPRQVFVTLEESEYLVIDSRDSTVVKHLANGTTENAYNSRQFHPTIFEKIPGGLLSIDWSGVFGFDVTLFIERSEPRW